MKPRVCKFKWINGILYTMTKFGNDRGWTPVMWAKRHPSFIIIEYIVPEDYKHEY